MQDDNKHARLNAITMERYFYGDAWDSYVSVFSAMDDGITMIL